STIATRFSWPMSFTYDFTWLPNPRPPQLIWTQFNLSPGERRRGFAIAELPTKIPAPATEACLRNARRFKLEFIALSMQNRPSSQNTKTLVRLYGSIANSGDVNCLPPGPVLLWRRGGTPSFSGCSDSPHLLSGHLVLGVWSFRIQALNHPVYDVFH